MSNPIVFYHSSDLDGKCSGAIIHRALKGCQLKPHNYGDEFPWDEVRGKDVIMADLSLQPGADMIKLRDVANSFTWIDHHKSAIEESIELGFNDLEGLRSTEEAACSLVWKFFHPDKEVPRGVQLLSKYDTWGFEPGDEAEIFQYGMQSVSHDPTESIWQDLLHGMNTNAMPVVDYNELEMSEDNEAELEMTPASDYLIESLLMRGQPIHSYVEMQNKLAAGSRAYETEVAGYKAIACNRSPANSSLFRSVWDSKKYDLMVLYGRLPIGKWTVSLFTDKKEIDCGKIARQLGGNNGGGHPGAAGFQCDEIPFKY